MNKNCFRVIFSKTLQCLVVTSELAKTEGKSTERASSRFPQLFAKIQPLIFSLFCALGFVSFSSTVSANLIIQADKSAPKTQQPIVLQTANGLPQVNIQTPNEQGLSHNKYSKFDVDTKGAILNNSRTNVQTQQGGWVQGNPYLARGEAKVILNEVNSSDPSVLKGYVEVAGKKADVIIANPSGIHCDGCGVINSDRTTLTTGKPQIQHGNLENFVVQKGKVSVSGKGLDNSRVDYTEIIARETQINAGVWSKKEMRVMTGKNTVKRTGKPEDLQIIHTNQATTQETKPQVAIDVGQLGGMYADKIHLIGTEQGVGVHNAGHIGANAETLKIDSQGRIVNSGTLNANKAVQLSGTKGIENRGKIENRQGDITLNSKSDIKQDGVIVARAGNIHKTADRGITQQGESIAKGNIHYNAPSVTASTRSLIAAGADVKDTAEGEKRSLENLSAQGKTIAINSSGKATLQGRNLASGKINVKGANVNLDKSHTSAYSININGIQGEIEANDAFLIAQRDLTLKTPTALQTQNSYLKADKISTQQRSLNTKNATWEQTGTSAFSINTVEQLQNQGGTFKTQGDFSVNAQGIDNRQGRFIANGKLTVDAGKNKVDSTGGALVSSQVLSVTSGELVNDGGLIQSQQSIRLNTQGQRLSNQQTLTDSQDKGIVALGELDIHSADLANQKGRLIANGKFTVDAGKNKVDSSGGELVSTKALSLTSGELVNDSGLIQSQQSIRLNTQGQRLSNQQTLTDSQDKGIVTLGELDIHSADLMNQKGRIVSEGNQQIKATEMNNTHGLMRTAQSLNLVAQSVQNHYGAISAKSTASLSIENTFAQAGGQVGANALILNAGNLNSTDKSLIAADRANIQVLGKFNHQQSRLNTLNDLTIQSQALSNTLGSINSVAGNIKINTQQQQLDNSQGHITAKGHIELDSGELQSQGGSIYSQQDIRIDTHNQLLNNQQTQGEYQGILSQGNLTVHAGKLDNTQGSISAKSSQLNITELANRFGILQSRDDLLLHAQRIDNTEGMISGAKKVVLAVSDLFTQKTGKVGAGELVLNAGTVDSTEKSLIVADNAILTVKGKLTNANSEVSTTQNLAITSQVLNNQRGLLLAERGNLTINSQQYHLNNQHGKIVAGQKIRLDSGALDNQQGLVQGQTGILLNTYQQYLNNTLGHIVSQQDLTIASGELNNRQGYLQSAKQGDIQIGSSSLHNQQGVISTGTNLRLNAGTVNNHDGVIESKNHLDANLSNLYQQNGVVQSGQSLNMTASGEVLSTNHSQIIGENVNITTSGQLDNQKSDIIAKSNGVIRSGQFNNREANLIAEQGNLEIHTKQQKLTSRLGKLSAGANLTINSGELDNRQGLIQSRQNMVINTHQGHLNNQQTQEQNKGIISLGGLALTTQDFLNQNGYLLSQKNQAIDAQSIHNDSGVLSSLASQNVTVSNAIRNIQGRISGVSSMVSAQSIDNQSGLLQGTHQLTIQTRDDINNEEGQVKAGDKLAIQTRGLNNHKGQVRAIEGRLAISSIENINNTLGYLTAKQQATITADGLNNHKGVVYNEQGLLSLKLQQNLDNQQGEVIGKENLKIESASLLNQKGKIYAEKQSNIGIKGLIDNRQNGKIYGMGETIIHTNQVDNRGGEIRTQDKLVLNATTGINNQKVGNTGSFIESGNELILNTADLNNSQTKQAQEKMTQGILASSLKLSARLVDNHQGKIHSRGQSHLSVQQTLDNRRGDVTGGSVSLEGKNLRIDNQGGRLQAERALSILADEVTTNGHIEGQDVSITQQKDFVTANSINADRNLRISTAGNLINQHNLYADESVTLNANHITNRVEGRISSANTQLSAKGNLINEGLINGVSLDDQAKTIVKAGGQLINTGKGRIYGDHVALEADRIENSDKNYGNEIKSAIIAARGDLDITAREIENNTAHYLSDHQVGATLFSIGEMRFGRTLNANHQAEGKAEVLRNNSSVIESERNIKLNVNQIHNNNTHFTVEHVKTGQAPNNITKLDEKEAVNETYIVPMGRNDRDKLKTNYTNPLNGDKSKINLDDPHISMKLLRWAGWSRAGKLVYKSDGAAPVLLKTGDVITADTPLAIRNEMTCDYMNGSSVCNYTPEGQYGKDSPIWAYFGVPAPQEPQPKFPFDELAEQSWFKESDWFDEEGNFKRPTKPHKWLTSPTVYRERLTKWNYYVRNIKPLEDWENKYRHSIDIVDNGIERHNKARLGSLRGKEYKEFWQLHITNRRKDESKVLTTVPGQILAGGDIEVHNQSFINDRSVVVAGQKMSLENQIQNIDEKGLHRVTDTGDKVFTFDKWRGGFKRYFQRKWENHGAYTRIIETPFDMKIFKVVENGDYAINKKTDDKLKNSTAHQLDLTQVKVNSDGLSSAGNLTLGTLGAGDSARFTQLGGDARQVDKLSAWSGKGQSVESKVLNGHLEGFRSLSPTDSTVRPLERIRLNDNQEVRSIRPNLVIPQNVLYRVNANPNNHVLIETDPDFTNHKRWLSSDYMFNAMRYEPNQVQKRLGDGFYEQRLVREQINRLTGRNFVGDYSDFDSQYKGLMDAGVTFAQKFNLRPGIALSPSQVARLTSDIVWLETEQVSLPNGKVESVLVPKVYAVARKGDITGNGALLSANQVTHKGGAFINSGTVAGREVVQFDSETIRNSGKISGGALVGNVRGDMDNLGGVLEADKAILLNVAGNFNHTSTTHTTSVNVDGYQRSDTRIGRKGLLHVKGENGTLQIQANNINLGGADIINDGKGQTYLSAKNNLNLTALSVGFDEKMGGGNHYRNERKDDVEISRIKGGGDVRLAAKNIYSQGAELESEAKLTALAENDLVLNGAKVSHDFEEFHKTKSGSLAKVTKTRFDKQQSETQRGSQVSGKEIVLAAGHEVKGKGLQAIAENDLLIQAGGNVDIAADTNHFRNIHKETKKTSGVFTGGGGITFGSKSEKHHLESEGWIQSDMRSTLVTNMVQAAYHRVKRREQVSNRKLKALYRIALFREYSKVSLL
ncbi:filamentous hemagglutinin N-terminal domain-containing protein [Rodentibacter pneumotropicus]|uniref:two-partner secretion domain-containing protein n=1 Tax=Rodentibacter pneumotropicus TaxID=758 RepID=UPI001EE1C1CD|nr:filamentous hemagglutinin N-terminal domain-containing protein [Rodentibacter pneumotropicus]